MKRIFHVFVAIFMVFNLLVVPNENIYALASNGFSQEYIVENIKFWIDESDKTNIYNAKYVSVDVTRRLECEDDDLLIFAFYTDKGELTDIYSDFINIDFSDKTNIRIPVTLSGDKLLGEVRVFVWNDFGDLEPLSNVLTTDYGYDTRFEVVPSPDDEEDSSDVDIYEPPDIFDEEIPPIVPSDKDDILPEFPGMDHVIEFP